MNALSILCSVAAHSKEDPSIKSEARHGSSGDFPDSDSAYYESLKRIGILPQDSHNQLESVDPAFEDQPIGSGFRNKQEDESGPAPKRHKNGAPPLQTWPPTLPNGSGKASNTGGSTNRSADDKPARHEYRHSKAHKALGIAQDYGCGYCGVHRTSASACSDGRVRIRCECGGVRQDSIPRIHANWKPLSGVRITIPTSEPMLRAAADVKSSGTAVSLPRSQSMFGVLDVSAHGHAASGSIQQLRKLSPSARIVPSSLSQSPTDAAPSVIPTHAQHVSMHGLATAGSLHEIRNLTSFSEMAPTSTNTINSSISASP